MNKEQRETMSALVPNTFPFPNYIIDFNEQLQGNIWHLLTGEEQNLLACVYRKTFGWWKREDNISLSQLHDMSGLSFATIRKYMKNLCAFKLVINVEEHNNEYGNSYAPQLLHDQIDFESLKKRATVKAELNARRTAKARVNSPLMSHITPYVAHDGGGHVAHDGGGHVAHDTQNTLSKTSIKNNKGSSFNKPEKVKLDPNEELQHVIWSKSNANLQALGDMFTKLFRNPMRHEFTYWLKGLQVLNALHATPEALMQAMHVAKKEWPDKIKSPFSFKTSVQKYIKKEGTHDNANNQESDQATQDAARAAVRFRRNAASS